MARVLNKPALSRWFNTLNGPKNIWGIPASPDKPGIKEDYSEKITLTRTEIELLLKITLQILLSEIDGFV